MGSWTTSSLTKFEHEPMVNTENISIWWFENPTVVLILIVLLTVVVVIIIGLIGLAFLHYKGSVVFTFFSSKANESIETLGIQSANRSHSSNPLGSRSPASQSLSERRIHESFQRVRDARFESLMYASLSARQRAIVNSMDSARRSLLINELWNQALLSRQVSRESNVPVIPLQRSNQPLAETATPSGLNHREFYSLDEYGVAHVGGTFTAVDPRRISSFVMRPGAGTEVSSLHDISRSFNARLSRAGEEDTEMETRVSASNPDNNTVAGAPEPQVDTEATLSHVGDAVNHDEITPDAHQSGRRLNVLYQNSLNPSWTSKHGGRFTRLRNSMTSMPVSNENLSPVTNESVVIPNDLNRGIAHTGSTISAEELGHFPVTIHIQRSSRAGDENPLGESVYGSAP